MKDKTVNENGKPPKNPDGNPSPESMQNRNNGQQPPKGDNPVNENYSEGGATATVQNVKINTSKDKSHQSILDVLIKMTHLVKKYRH